MSAEIIKNNRLISYTDWENYIDSLKTSRLIKNRKEAIDLVNSSLFSAMKKRASKLRKFGILFSGGVDSSLIALIAKNMNCDFTCYSVGLEGSKDIASAEETALSLGFRLRTKIISLSEAED